MVYNFLNKLLKSNSFFKTAFLVKEETLHFIKIFLLKIRGARIGKNVRIYGKVKIEGNIQNLVIDNRVRLNHNVYINCRDKVIIKSDVHVSTNTMLLSAGLIVTSFPRIHYCKPIIVEQNVWLCANCVINPGVKVGENAVVLPGAVVTKDVPSNTIVGGVPAKVLKRIV